MLDTTNKQPSRFWPYLKTAAKAVKIPGTDLTVGSLADLQDQLSADEAQKKTAQALDRLLTNVDEMVSLLRNAGADASEETVTAAVAELAEEVYLRSVADQYLYSDFKGIEQLEKLVPLKLDEVFVNLKVQMEQGTERGERESELFERLVEAEGSERERAEQGLADLDLLRMHGRKHQDAPVTIDQALKHEAGTVLLGGPGSGKTTLVKRLARSLALGTDVAHERYPDLSWGVPVVLPVAWYDVHGDDRPIFDYLKARLLELGGQALVTGFEARWSQGQVIVLLDGLDEVVDAGRRVACARAAGELVRGVGRNRVLMTSRPVGYSICRLSVPARHVTLEPFGSDDIATFVRQWHLTYDRAVHAERPDPAAAAKAAEELLDDIRGNDRVASLATQPLMLTIIALIKQQNVTLPERRVGLYEIALNTLIRSWNKARSLANRPTGEDLGAEETKKVWAAVAYWMHTERSTGTVHGAQLQQRVVDLLIDFGHAELEAEKTAESYIRSASERAGLLEERGTNVFAFLHQTFQEYLAARHLWLSRPRSKAIERVLAVAGDPRWHEVVRLTAGFVGVIQEDDEMVTELVEALAEERDPLEPFFCNALRVAASCIADDVRVSPKVAGAIVVRLCQRLQGSPHRLLQSRLAETFRSMRTYKPDEQALEALQGLSEHSSWEVRQEAARILSRVPAQAISGSSSGLDSSAVEASGRRGRVCSDSCGLGVGQLGRKGGIRPSRPERSPRRCRDPCPVFRT